MSASPSFSSPASVPVARTSGLAAVLFAAMGALLGIVAFAFVMASVVAPAEIAAHPVARAAVGVAPIVATVGALHLAVAVGLLAGSAVARLGAVVVAVSGVALSAVELLAIAVGRDPLAAETTDPARAAQSGAGIMVVVAAIYVTMLAASAWPRRR